VLVHIGFKVSCWCSGSWFRISKSAISSALTNQFTCALGATLDDAKTACLSQLLRRTIIANVSCLNQPVLFL